MAIQSEISQISYLGNGSTGTGYPVPFYFFEDTNLKVSRTDAAGVVTQLSLGAHYSVSGAGNASGGSVTTTTAYGGSDRITIARVVPATQPLTYEENDRFPAKSHERGLDRLTMLAQQVGRAAKRCFRLGDSQNEIPPIEARTPNSLAGLDGDGAPKLYTIDQLLTLISLPAPVLNRPMKTFADNGGRTAAVPDFVGQLGTQQDTKWLFIATGLSAGNWTPSIFPLDQFNASLIHGQANDGTIAGTGEFLFTPDPFSALKRGTFEALAAWIIAQVPDPEPPPSPRYSYAEVTTTLAALTGRINMDPTRPQIGDGDQIIVGAITPSATTSKVRITAVIPFGCAEAARLTTALFRNGQASALDAIAFIGTVDGQYAQMVIDFVDAPATVSEVTYQVRMGLHAPGTYGVNPWYGASKRATLFLQELKA